MKLTIDSTDPKTGEIKQVIEVTQQDGSIKRDIIKTDPKTRIATKVEETETSTKNDD